MIQRPPGQAHDASTSQEPRCVCLAPQALEVEATLLMGRATIGQTTWLKHKRQLQLLNTMIAGTLRCTQYRTQPCTTQTETWYGHQNSCRQMPAHIQERTTEKRPIFHDFGCPKIRTTTAVAGPFTQVRTHLPTCKGHSCCSTSFAGPPSGMPRASRARTCSQRLFV